MKNENLDLRVAQVTSKFTYLTKSRWSWKQCVYIGKPSEVELTSGVYSTGIIFTLKSCVHV